MVSPATDFDLLSYGAGLKSNQKRDACISDGDVPITPADTS